MRVEYRDKSSKAAELSLLLKSLQETNKKLSADSEGVFQKLQVASLMEKQEYYKSQINKLKSDSQMWSQYLMILNAELKKRVANLPNSNYSESNRNARSSRNVTPYT